jgi:dihydroxyacetone kinase-like protein
VTAPATPGDVLIAVAAALTAARDELNRLDGAAGDGDLGLTAHRAAEALVETVPTLAGMTPADAIKAVGMTVARRAPSTGGTLIAFACLAAARVPPRSDADPVALVGDLLVAARDEVATRGKVAVGDRTMLDALAPAVDAYRERASAGASLAAALDAAATAAEAGAAATVGMEATTGRAGWLADRARGHEDAGARLIAIVLRAIADAAA